MNHEPHPLAAAANPTRRQLLSLIGAHPGVHQAHLVTQVRLKQTTVSEHLRTLVAAGLLRNTRDGKHMRYYLDPTGITTIRRLLPALTRPAPREH